MNLDFILRAELAGLEKASLLRSLRPIEIGLRNFAANRLPRLEPASRV